MMRSALLASCASVILSVGIAAASPLSEPVGKGCYPQRNFMAGYFAKGIFKPVIPLSEIEKISDGFEKMFAPQLADLGQELDVELDDTATEFNAFAWTEGQRSVIRLNSKAIAFQPMVNKDVVALLLCHELGHHLGGAPLKSDSQMSVEGQADYFATAKCMRQFLKTPLFAGDKIKEHPYAQNYCSYFFVREEAQLCARSIAASEQLSIIGANLNLEPMPKLTSFDKSVVKEVPLEGHSSAQCRLDSLRAGGFCRLSERTPMTKTAPNLGSCLEDQTSQFEVRPRCWFIRAF